MISFDEQTGKFELKGTGEDIAKAYIGITCAIGRTMLEAGVEVSTMRSSLSTLAAQGITFADKPENEEKPKNIIDFVTGGEDNV